MTELDKNYDPANIESRWYQEWLNCRYFHADAATPKAPSPTATPMLGITLTILAGFPSMEVMLDVVTPAMMEMMIRDSSMDGARALIAVFASWGFTASMR